MPEPTFMEVFEQFKAVTAKMDKMVSNERFTHKSIGWESEARRQELQSLIERIEVAKQTLEEINENIKTKRKEEDDTTRQIHEQAEAYKKRKIKEFEYIQQHKDLLEKKVFNQIKEQAEA